MLMFLSPSCSAPCWDIVRQYVFIKERHRHGQKWKQKRTTNYFNTCRVAGRDCYPTRTANILKNLWKGGRLSVFQTQALLHYQ